jgi:hypothetical protein
MLRRIKTQRVSLRKIPGNDAERRMITLMWEMFQKMKKPWKRELLQRDVQEARRQRLLPSREPIARICD